MSRIQELLTEPLLKGRVVSADALHTQRPFCLSTVLAGGEYLLIAEGNQATLRQDVQFFFTEPPRDCRDWRTASQTKTGHGRLEQRWLIASTELNDFLSKEWYGIGQIFRLLSQLREHWAIENRLHWRRDVTLREDACQVRKGSAPRALAVLNSFLLALFD